MKRAHWSRVCVWLSVFSVSPTRAVLPQSVPPPQNEAFLRAAIVVTAFDRLSVACQSRGGLSGEDAKTVTAWQTKNGVAGLRTRIHALGRAEQSLVEQGAERVTAAVAGQGVGPCAASLSMTRLPDAQFATHAPQLLAPPARTVDLPAPAPPEGTTPSSARLLSDIDSFGFDTRLTMGVGGFLTTSIFPVVLFKSGDVLRDVGGLAFAGGLTAHKRAKPSAWTRWRRSGGRLEVEREKGWSALPFQATYAALPPDFRLDGRFSTLAGTGNVAVGGTDSVTAWREYRFTRDGRVVRGGGAGARSETGDASVVTRSVAPNRRGQYRIDGLTLHITYDDGSSEQRILITNPAKPTAIWIDGVGYVQ